jgi:hypothetical protein
MIGLLCFAVAVLCSPFKSKLRLEAENAVLRQQLIVLRRRLHGRVRLTNHDRWFLIHLYRWFPSIDPRSLAPGRLSALLALEIASTGRAAASRDGAAGADPADEYREPTLGRAAHSRRTAQAGV